MLENLDAGVEQNTVTNAGGSYVFQNLLPSSYLLTASKEGFKTSRVETLVLEVNQTARLDFELEVGKITESITVSAEGIAVQSSTSELGEVIAEREVSDLPLDGRNFTQLLRLTPGVAPLNVSQSSGGFTAAAIGQFTFPSVNGQTNRSNFFMLDGIFNLGTVISTPAVEPIVDTIREFKVQAHNDQAEFGQAVGGIVNVVTKSGTNQLHGTAWEFLRNDALDSRNFFQPEVTPFRQNQFGATAGGPIVRNKAFFFAGYQGFRFRRPDFSFFRVPTAANLNGDLSDTPQAIFDPFSTRPDPSAPGAFLRDPFPNNQISSVRLDQGMVAYAQAILPDPVFTGVGDRNAIGTQAAALRRFPPS